MHDIKLFCSNNHNKQKKLFRPILFLDRDGVLIKEKHYISDSSNVELEKGAYQLLIKAYEKSIGIVVVTNQSGISRGFFNWHKYDLVTKKMLELIGPKNPIIGIFANGYGPEDHMQYWRKPNPGMLKEAAKLLNIDLKNSFLVGDRLTDLIAGQRAGLKGLVHVKTGHGLKERDIILKKIKEDQTFNNVEDKDNKTLFINDLNELGEEFFKKLLT